MHWVARGLRFMRVSCVHAVMRMSSCNRDQSDNEHIVMQTMQINFAVSVQKQGQVQEQGGLVFAAAGLVNYNLLCSNCLAQY